MTNSTTSITTTTILFTSASSKGFTPVRNFKGVCARIKCGVEGCQEQAFIFRNADGKVINACTCGWRRIAPSAKKWGKTVVRAPRPVNEVIEAAFAAKKAAALEAAALRAERLREEAAQDAKIERDHKSLALLDEQTNKDMSEFKPDMS